MGEFKKRIKAFRKNTNRLKVFTDEEATMIQNSMILLVEEAKKEFPSRRDFLEVMKYIELGFSDDKPYKKFLLNTVKKAKDAMEKWFMDSADEAEDAEK